MAESTNLANGLYPLLKRLQHLTVDYVLGIKREFERKISWTNPAIWQLMTEAAILCFVSQDALKGARPVRWGADGKVPYISCVGTRQRPTLWAGVG